MNEKFYISIPEPCHEDWNKMSAVEQGRFCDSCKKKVIDFTTKSEDEIITFFNNYNGNSCGRFTNEQLNRPIQSLELKPASRFIRYAASLLLPAALFAEKAKAQVGKVALRDTVERAVSLPVVTLGFFVEAPAPKRNFVSGNVIDAVTKEPLAGVSILIKGTKNGVVTDADGNFFIAVQSRKDVLQFSSVGYEASEAKLSKITDRNAVVVQMKQAPTLLADVNVTGYKTITCRSLKGGVSIKRISTYTVMDKVKDTVLPAKVKIYPNPVAASETINVSFPDVSPGLYQLRLLSATGQLFYSFQKQVSGKGETEQIHLSGNTAPGIYIVQVLDEKKKLVQSTKISIQ